MFEGLLVDLVPFNARFDALQHKWENGPAAYWGDAGDRQFFSRATIERFQQEHRDETGPRQYTGFGIQTKDGTPIGTIGMGFLSAHHRHCMFGAQIGEPEYWGGGYGTDALLLMLDYVFDWLDYRKVWLGTMGLNARVIRQMAKVGFSLEARHRDFFFADGVWTEHLVYAMLREEWPGRVAMVEKLGLKARQEG